MSRRVWIGTLALAALCVAVGVALYEALAGVDASIVMGGDRFELRAPRALALLAICPLVWWWAALSLADLPASQRGAGALGRTLLLASLALALAQPARRVERSRISTVFVVDVSESVSDRDLERARQYVQEAWQQRGENDLQLVTFARRPRRVPLQPGERVPQLQRPQDAAGSDLQAALKLAYGLYPPGHLRRLVLLSDGVETHGTALAEIERANQLDIRIFSEPLVDGPPPEVAIRALRIPDDIDIGQPFHVHAEIFATQATRARVRLYQGETLNGLDGVRDVDLEEGVTRLKFRSIIHTGGEVSYRLRLQPQGRDRFEPNNRFAVTARVPGRPGVLYVEGQPESAHYFAQALTAAGFAVDVRRPEALPRSLRELERYEFVVLSDVSATHVSSSQADILERYLRDLGGGLLVAGGEHAFGPGGYQDSPLEPLLPVRMGAERRRDEHSLALSLVIDTSGSMTGQKIELAKDAAKATAELLGSGDFIGVVGFASRPEHVVRMQSAHNRYRILHDIGRLDAQGGTAIFPALDAAFQELAVTRARVKHVILLTDGQTRESGIPELVQAMRAESITVSAVGLGQDVNRALLQSVANLGGGRAYFTHDPHNIPRIFTRETTQVARNNVVEEYVRAQIAAPADFLKGVAIGSAPYLHGYVATKPRAHPAQVILQSDLGEPLLARWRIGLGWSLAWTSDLKNRWAVQWLRWPGYSQLWAQLVREHMRRQRRDRLPMQASVHGGEARVRVDALGADDAFINGLRSTLRMHGPVGSEASRARQARMQQVAPGRYETRLPLDEYGSFVLEAVHSKNGRVVAESHAQLTYPYPLEYAMHEPQIARLRELATATGGRIGATPARIFDPDDERIAHHQPLWPWLVGTGLLLFLLDLGLRRIPWGRRRDVVASREAPGHG